MDSGHSSDLVLATTRSDVMAIDMERIDIIGHMILACCNQTYECHLVSSINGEQI